MSLQLCDLVAGEGWIDSFLALKAANTQRHYRHIFAELAAFLAGRNKTMETCGAADALYFAEQLLKMPGSRNRHDSTEAKVTRATALHKCVVCRGLYRYAPGDARNPFDAACKRLEGAETGEKRPTKALSNEQVKTLLGNARPFTPWGKRDAAFLNLLFGGGMRLGEALGLRLIDVQRDGELVYLVLRQTKAQKAQEQVLPAWAAAPVLEYRQQRIEEGAKPEESLLIRYQKQKGIVAGPLIARCAYALFKRLCRDAGLPQDISPHSARATAATRGLEQGWSFEEARRFLRHASTRMVETYDKRKHERSKSASLLLIY